MCPVVTLNFCQNGSFFSYSIFYFFFFQLDAKKVDYNNNITELVDLKDNTAEIIKICENLYSEYCDRKNKVKYPTFPSSYIVLQNLPILDILGTRFEIFEIKRCFVMGRRCVEYS